VFLIAGMTFSLFIWVSPTRLSSSDSAAYYGTVLGPSFMVGMTGLADRPGHAKHFRLAAVHPCRQNGFLHSLRHRGRLPGWTLTTTHNSTGTITVSAHAI
jgi:hypothetical protein